MRPSPAGPRDGQSTKQEQEMKTKTLLAAAHAVGGQLGFTYVPWLLSVNFHGSYEYAARNRFQGQSLGLNISRMF